MISNASVAIGGRSITYRAIAGTRVGRPCGNNGTADQQYCDEGKVAAHRHSFSSPALAYGRFQAAILGTEILIPRATGVTALRALQRERSPEVVVLECAGHTIDLRRAHPCRLRGVAPVSWNIRSVGLMLIPLSDFMLLSVRSL